MSVFTNGGVLIDRC